MSNSHSLPEILNLSKSSVLRLLPANLPTTTTIPVFHSEAVLYSRILQSLPSNSSHPCLGHVIHCHVIKSGLLSYSNVANSLLSFHFRLHRFKTNITRNLFNELLPLCDVISWTSMLSSYLKASQPEQGFKLFAVMPKHGIEPNSFTLSAAAKACSALSDARVGASVHAVVLTRGFSRNFVVSSSLMDMYGKCALPKAAQKVFDEMPERDAICWTSIISAFTKNDNYEEALYYFFLMMRQKSVKPELDEFTFGSVLTALANLNRLKQGKQAHAKSITSGVSRNNVVVESSIVDLYAKCGLMQDSRRAFDKMAVKNAVSWCALLGGYCNLGFYETVINLFKSMNKEMTDVYTFGIVLRACASLAVARMGKEIHARVYRTSRVLNHVVFESALVDLYAKCGLIDYAHEVFVRMPVRNTISWNAMICGLAQNGRGQEAIKLFKLMSKEGNTKPDYITFVGALFACSHTGMVKQGKKLFKLMDKKYNISSRVEHYSCMVDLLGRVGQLEEAEKLINGSGFENEFSLWASLLGACATHSNVDLAERVVKRMMGLDPFNHLSYVLLANVYNTVGRFKDAMEIRKMMKERCVKKSVGTSWIETGKIRSTHEGFGVQNIPRKSELGECILHCLDSG
ncbi:hypothetical protein LUZ60_017056 [Juncus effusus]|nr:hypothetical protein LUZ60_017056 [Juncus effusus]